LGCRQCVDRRHQPAGSLLSQVRFDPVAGSGALADLLDKSMGVQLPDTGPGCTFLLKYFKYCTGIGIVRERRSRAAHQQFDCKAPGSDLQKVICEHAWKSRTNQPKIAAVTRRY
jgi:hypothetical protein